MYGEVEYHFAKWRTKNRVKPDSLCLVVTDIYRCNTND